MQSVLRTASPKFEIQNDGVSNHYYNLLEYRGNTFMQYNFALQVYYNRIIIPAETRRRYGVLETDWNNIV